jgi:hypothetical protein
MKMEITVNTIDKTKPNNRNTSLKTLYPRYTHTIEEKDAPKACISTIIATKPSKHNPIL